MIVELNFEPLEVEAHQWYWHGIDVDILLGTQYIPPDYNFDKKKKKKRCKNNQATTNKNRS